MVKHVSKDGQLLGPLWAKLSDTLFAMFSRYVLGERAERCLERVTSWQEGYPVDLCAGRYSCTVARPLRGLPLWSCTNMRLERSRTFTTCLTSHQVQRFWRQYLQEGDSCEICARFILMGVHSKRLSPHVERVEIRRHLVAVEVRWTADVVKILPMLSSTFYHEYDMYHSGSIVS